MSENNLITIKKARLSYPYLFEKKQPRPADKIKTDPAYIADFLLHKKDNAVDIKRLQGRIEKAAIEEGFEEDWRSPLKDGDEREDENYHGHLYFAAKKKSRRPVLVDQRKQTIKDVEDSPFYPGCLVNVNVSVFAYDIGNKGVSLGLEAVQFAGDGEPLGGGPSRAQAISGFDEIAWALDEDFDPLAA